MKSIGLILGEVFSCLAIHSRLVQYTRIGMYHGTGIYSVPEASRLIAVPNRDIRRWHFGYHYRKTPGDADSRVDIAPLWATRLVDE
jgi:hypothetical protein